MSFVAVAMASGGADLSDETGSAVGPATIYAFLFVGALFNVVLVEDSLTRVAGLILYGLAGWTYWQAGVEQAGFCMDAEAVRVRRVRAADAMTWLIFVAVGGRALQAVDRASGGALGRDFVFVSQAVLLLLVGIAAAIYLARRPRAVPRLGVVASLLVAAGAGALATGAVVAAGGAVATEPALNIAVLAVVALAEEAVFRGVLQRALPLPRLGAAAISLAAGVVCAQLSSSALGGGRPGPVIAIVIGGHAAASLAYALTGRVTASWIARLVMVLPLARL
jgi:membrane protease YdiL (CAAX protease family)